MKEVTISDDLRTNYHTYYDDGDSEWRRLGALGKAANVISLCSSLPTRTILEIGAGEGSLLKRLSELDFGNELYALEISASGVDTIRDKAIGRLVECQVFDGSNVPYEEGRFDIAILSHVVEHLEHPRQLLREASRVARFVFVEVPLEDTIRQPRDFVFDQVGHINSYSPESIRRLVQSCDLRVLREAVTNPPMEVYTYARGLRGAANYIVKELLLRVAPRAATKLFSYHAALICERSEPSP